MEKISYAILDSFQFYELLLVVRYDNNFNFYFPGSLDLYNYSWKLEKKEN
jgi:hypothetical protein